MEPEKAETETQRIELQRNETVQIESGEGIC